MTEISLFQPLAAQKSPVPVAAPAAPAPGSLGNNADFVLTPADIHSVLPPPGTVKAWHLRSLGRDLLRTHGIERRMRWCGSRISPIANGVQVFARPDRAYGRVSGVCVCGQSVCCPVCAPRIAAFRSAEVAEAYKRAKNAGWEPRLETFTKPHKFSLRPDALLLEFRTFSDLWRSYQKNADRREPGAEGHHLGREITWGTNGWHYHHHRLRYDKPGQYNQHLAKAQWLAVLEQYGLRTEGTEEHAYDCGDVTDEAGAVYCAKLSTAVEAQARAIGSEIASAATKGRNLNTLLSDHARGDISAAAIWVNGVACVTATKVSSVRWSRNLRAKLGLNVGDKSDEQIAAEEVTSSDELLGTLTSFQWRGIIAHKAEFTLCVAANRGREHVDELLCNLDLGILGDAAE